MYHRFRSLHRWFGVLAALALLLIAGTGFLLATKKTTDWIRPLERKGTPVESLASVVSVNEAAEAAFALGLPMLKDVKDIDRIDYRPKSNVFKVVSKTGYKEVQVDGATGRVLNVAQRNDQFIEQLHDFSWFHDYANMYGLPVVALALLFLAGSGIGIFFVPILRRRKFKKTQKPQATLFVPPDSQP
jgi:uncharacterized iron-regulated membrane protein